jgi:L-malate glycosyltransferase
MALFRSAEEVRIALVLSELRPGGMERLVVHLAEELARRDCAVQVICLQSPGVLASLLNDEKIPVVSLEGHGGKNIVALWRLRKELSRFQATVINLHDYASLPYAALANLFAGSRPLVFTAHGLLYVGFETLQKRLRFFSRFLADISAVSEEVAKRHQAYLDWNKPIQIIANAVPAVPVNDESRRQVRAELGCSDDTHLFLAVGNLVPEKSYEDLLDAAALLRLQNIKFMVAIAGTLTENQYCRELLSKLERLQLAANCIFLGFRKDTAALYSAADSFVLSSQSEGLPMVILEAMTAGLPVIATRVGGIPDAVGDNALLVDAQNPEQLAEAMNQMLIDSELRRRLAEAGKKHAAINHGVERMVDKYLSWYRQALNNEH